MAFTINDEPREFLLKDMPADPVTVRAVCETCRVKRLFLCERVGMRVGHSVVRATCLTCGEKTVG